VNAEELRLLEEEGAKLIRSLGGAERADINAAENIGRRFREIEKLQGLGKASEVEQKLRKAAEAIQTLRDTLKSTSGESRGILERMNASLAGTTAADIRASLRDPLYQATETAVVAPQGTLYNWSLNPSGGWNAKVGNVTLAAYGSGGAGPWTWEVSLGSTVLVRGTAEGPGGAIKGAENVIAAAEHEAESAQPFVPHAPAAPSAPAVVAPRAAAPINIETLDIAATDSETLLEARRQQMSKVERLSQAGMNDAARAAEDRVKMLIDPELSRRAEDLQRGGTGGFAPRAASTPVVAPPGSMPVGLPVWVGGREGVVAEVLPRAPGEAQRYRVEFPSDSTSVVYSEGSLRVRKSPPASGGSKVSELLTPYNVQGVASLGEADLARRAQAGDKAATDELVMRVENLVKKMANDMKRPGVEFEDLFQEGMIGALDAVKGFDPTKAKWSTWAWRWISGAMRASRGGSRVVKLASGKRTSVRRFWAAIDELRATHGFEPEMGEVREHMGLTTEAFDNLLAAATGPASKPMGGYEAAKMAPARVEVGEIAVEAAALHEAKSEDAIRAGLNAVLTPREVDVFWMSVFEEKSTTQIAMKFNARHAAIKRNLELALEKLRAAMKAGTLRRWPALVILALFAGGIVQASPASADEASAASVAQHKAAQTPPLQVRRVHICGTDMVVYSAWEPSPPTGSAHGTITHDEAGNSIGKVGTDTPPPEIQALPPRTEQRSKAVQAWYDAQKQRAYDAILAEHPGLVGTPSDGEIITIEPGTK